MGTQIKDLITAGQLQSVTNDICEKSTEIFVKKSDFKKEIEKVTEEISSIEIPSKISDLNNDSNFVEFSDLSAIAISGSYNDLNDKPSIPSTTSNLTNDSGFITAADIPTKVSNLDNDSDFITNAVNDLVNYYLKSETYTKAEVDSITAAILNSRFEVVEELPVENIETNVIYLVPKANAESDNIKDEYINIDGTSEGWEKIGDTQIDLSSYTTTEALNTVLEDYVETADLSTVATSGSYNDLTDKPSIPANVSDLTNDAGYITLAEVPEVTVPTKISDLTDDSNFVESSDLSAIATSGSYNDLTDKPIIPSTTSDLTNDSGFITSADLPTVPENISDLTNDSGFVTNIVNDLANYYLKSETYTKAEVDTLTATIKNSRFEVVSELPTEDIETNVIYLVPSNDPKTNNAKDEYINLDGTVNGWEKIGSTEIDLTGYTTTEALNTVLEDYVESSDLSVVATSGSYNDLTDKPDPLTPGDGINITNNVISTDNLQPGDIDDIVSPEPSIIMDDYDLGDLNDILLSTPIDGQSLIYNATNSKWVNGEPGGSAYYRTDDNTENTIDDADYIPFFDASDEGKKKSQWSTIKSLLKEYFDTLYKPIIKTATLTAGSTTVTFTDMPTSGNNLIDFFTSNRIECLDVTESGSTVTVTYEAQSSDITVYCRIERI